MNDEKRDDPAANEVPRSQRPGDENQQDNPNQGETAEASDAKVSAPFEEIRADFHPFYEKEARTDQRVKTASTAFLYILLSGLGLALLGLVIDVLFKGPSYKLEVTTTAIVCFTLIGILWKSITLEVKAGLVAVSLGLILAWPQIKSVQEGIAFPWVLSADLIWPVFFALSLAAVLLAIWLLWPRMGWLPGLLSLPVLYAALAPVFSLILEETTLKDVILGPSFMSIWPIFIRSGYLAVEVILPLGILLMIILQVRTLIRKHHKIHFGYIFWALFLVLGSFIGLSVLEADDKPVALPVNQLAKLSAPASEPALESKAVPSDTEGKTASISSPSKIEQPPEEAAPLPEQKVKSVPQSPTSVTEPKEALEPESSKIAELEGKIETLEKELEHAKQRLEAQEAMIKSLQMQLKREQPSLKQEVPRLPKKPSKPSVSLDRT
ncbi:MAG: hypothetical protein JRI34_08000 [Deltaproteobacteria bacterium]|nr:hypothetical protein [Deltaproteobacteria bacterium]